jgi:transposase
MTTILSANRQNVGTTANAFPPRGIYPAQTGRPSLAKIVHAATQTVGERNLTYMISTDAHAVLNPKPLLALLCLAYAQGIYSSKEIENVMRANQELQKTFGEAILDASVLSRFRNDNWNTIRTCLVTVLWFMAEQKIAEGFVTKANRSHIEQEASRRMTAAAFSDSECGWN